uniref:Uncharacterized protein n=1 Tax=Arundo donax TaxID=35708 RepID=A0A0A8YT26_ARUDO
MISLATACFEVKEPCLHPLQAEVIKDLGPKSECIFHQKTHNY